VGARAILSSQWVSHAARVALVSAFLIGGLTKLSDVTAAVAEQEHFGFRPGGLWATLAITVELGGSALVVLGRLVWLGAGGLGSIGDTLRNAGGHDSNYVGIEIKRGR
jgi:uncharacterized membrane protein YphA (DoxX/SURF4 family)